MAPTAVHPHVALREATTKAQDEQPLALAEGIELIGEYEDSGFKEAPWIARRADGSVIQLTKLLYQLAEAADGRRSTEEIATRVSESCGRTVSAENVHSLATQRLRPLGVLAAADGSSPEILKANQLLALKLKKGVIPERVVGVICTVFKPLFLAPVMIAVLVGLLVFDAWLFFVHGVGDGLRDALYQPAAMFLLLGLVVVGTAFHECGHAAGCAYGGARPGVMGAGLYFVWPAFYTDVTDSYRLSKRGRLRTDLGGVYFNFIFILALAGLYALTGFEPLLLVIMVQHFAVLQQMLPFLRLDGYYVLSDLTGVPDMFTRMKPILTDLVPGKDGGDKVRALKPWVRVVTTLWIGLLIPVVIFNILFLITQVPRIYATAYDSLLLQTDAVSKAVGDGDALGLLAGVVQTIALVLPVAGVTYTFVRLGRRIVTGVWGFTDGRPPLRAGLAVVLIGLAGLAAWSWWPNGEYRPLQEGEELNVQTVSRSVAEVPSGRPALTEARQQELGGVPTERQRRTASTAPESSVPPGPGPAGPATPAGPAAPAAPAATTSTSAGSSSTTRAGAVTPSTTVRASPSTTVRSSPSTTRRTATTVPATTTAP